jgi:hypothetical protein
MLMRGAVNKGSIHVNITVIGVSVWHLVLLWAIWWLCSACDSCFRRNNFDCNQRTGSRMYSLWLHSSFPSDKCVASRAPLASNSPYVIVIPLYTTVRPVQLLLLLLLLFLWRCSPLCALHSWSFCSTDFYPVLSSIKLSPSQFWCLLQLIHRT